MSSVPSWRQAVRSTLRRDPLVRTAAGLYGAFLVVAALPVIGADALTLASRLAAIGLLAVAAVSLQWRLSRVAATEDWKFWNDLSIAFGFWGLATLGLVLTEALDLPSWARLLISVLHALSFVFLLMAIERQPHRRHRWRPLDLERRLAWLTVVVVVLGLFVYFPLLASRNAGEDASGLPDVLLRTVLGTYASLRMCYLWYRARGPRWRLTYGLLAAALLVALGSSVVSASVFLGGLAKASWRSLHDLAWPLAFALVVVAARLRHASFPALPERRRDAIRLAENLPGPLGQTLVFLLVLPLIHFVYVGSGRLHPATLLEREDLVVLVVLALAAIAFLQYRILARTIVHLQGERTQSERALHSLEKEMRLQEERQQTSKALRASDERFAKAFRACPDVMAISRLEDGRLTDVNPSCQRLFGWRPEEWVGRTLTEVGVWAELEDRDRILARLHEDGRVHEHELRYRTKDGDTGVGRFSATVLEIDGEPHIFSVTFDATSSHRRVAVWQRRVDLLDGAACAIAAVDGAGRVTYWNRAAEELFGKPAAEVLGEPAASLGVTGDAGDGDAGIGERLSIRLGGEEARSPAGGSGAFLLFAARAEEGAR